MVKFTMTPEEDQEVQDAFDGKIKAPAICEECGKGHSDPPSKLCPGCQAYRDHTGFF